MIKIKGSNSIDLLNSSELSLMEARNEFKDYYQLWIKVVHPYLISMGLDNEEFYKSVPTIGNYISMWVARDGGLTTANCFKVLNYLNLKLVTSYALVPDVMMD